MISWNFSAYQKRGSRDQEKDKADHWAIHMQIRKEKDHS